MSIRTSLDYSSVILNQNRAPTSSSSKLSINDEQWRYQSFFLPANFARGSSETFVPQLSGLQIFGSVPEHCATSTSFEWVLERRNFGVGWVTLASGRQLGVEHSGEEVWSTVLFEGVDVQNDLEERYRIGIKSRIPTSGASGEGRYENGVAFIGEYQHTIALTPNTPIEVFQEGADTILVLDDDWTTVHWYHSTGISALWFSNPNPLADQYAYATDANENALLDGSDEFSLNFRILGLTADEGVDFLGNRYRSAVRTQSAESTDSINGDPNRAWVSKPNPSRFAVESLYFDIRPRSQAPRYGMTNYMRDPNGEGPMNGFTDSGGSSHISSPDRALFRGRSIKVSTSVQGDSFMYWRVPTGDMSNFQSKTAHLSFYSYHSSTWSHTGDNVRVGGMRQISGLSDLKVVAADSIPRDKWVRRTFEIEDVDSSKILELVFDNQGVGDVYYSGIMLTVGAHDNYADGGFPEWSWAGMPHNSVSIQRLESDPDDELTVVDRIFIDPVTPGIWCSIYYSHDGDPGTTDDEWDNRQWKRVNMSCLLKEKKAYALPEPIFAKYIKLEFTHLHPQQYSPGNFAQPIPYKKHPRWVLEYFMARLESDRRTTEQTVANKVGVVYDTLDLLYNYYLDDLGQEPILPVQSQPEFDIQKTSEGLYQDVMDIEMVNKISTVLKPYSEYATNWGSGSLLGEISLLNANLRLEDYPFEKATGSDPRQKVDYAALRNVSVAFEADYPVMFFYLDGPHEYRVAQAALSHNRAYFAGIREVAFLRDSYLPEFDAVQYIENGGDTFNAERSEFTIIDGKLTIPR